MRVSVAVGLILLFLPASFARSQGYAPDVAASKMLAADGLEVTCYASEPNIRQPILVKFDDRGRLWTIQYLQYPNPAGLKRVKVDRWSRTVYDRVPEPPPKGPRGADRITIAEDTDGDGRADRFKDFVDGLNLCTGLAFGHGGVFILQTPYLLFYPDHNRDDVPDGDPRVLLSGFGMEDAQSLVNHLTWGPDGWLYGVTGSTSSNLVRGVEFQQAVWRYHPRREAFELFCEGGGNLFGLTFDADGNLFFSSNGNDLAYHALQGAYYRKNFGKHGPLHNPYAYGFFEHLPYDHPVAGPRPGGTIYTDVVLPERYRGALLCCEFLQHAAAAWRLERTGSTFTAKHLGTLVDSRDTWFCPPDLCQGPDGAVYLCDFHDRRTAHPDPDAQWDRSNGRIYRIAPPGLKPIQGLDLAKKGTEELVGLLKDRSGWIRERARDELAARRDHSAWPELARLARQTDDPRLALQGVWGLYVTEGFNDSFAAEVLKHPAEYVRAWTVRFLADSGRVSQPLAKALVELAASESSVVVRCQLAASSRRLPGEQGLPIIETLARGRIDARDPTIPLMLWWAIEAKALTDTERLLRFFTEPAVWTDPLCRDLGLKLIRRLAAEGTPATDAAVAQLLPVAPVGTGLMALDQGLAERGVKRDRGLGMSGLYDSLAIPRARRAVAAPAQPLSNELVEAIDRAWTQQPGEIVRLRLAVRAGVAEAIRSVREEVIEPGITAERRVALLGLLTMMGSISDMPIAFELLRSGQPIEVRAAALDLVARHGQDTASAPLLAAYATSSPSFRARLREVLLGRRVWARAFLDRVDRGEIPAAEVPLDQLRGLALLEDPDIDALVRKHWGRIQAGTPEERLAEVRRLSNDLRAGAGDRERGKALFQKHCGTCHTLFGEGGIVGPDLTGVARADTIALLTSIVDPSAVIRAQYQTYAAVTRAGRVVSGLLIQQDNTGLTFLDGQNQRTTISRDDVEELRELPTSLMPDNLLSPLNPQEVRDLFRYLQQATP